MKHSFFKSGVAALTALSLFAPSASFALTPTQWFNQMVRSSNTATVAEAADATLDISVAERFNDKKRKGDSGKINLSFSIRALPKKGAVQTSEGAFSLNTLVMSDSTLGLPFSITEPIAFEWKQTDDMVFFRINKIPASLLDYLQGSSETDFSGLIGKWIGMPFDQGSILEEAGIPNAQNPNDVFNKGPLAKVQLITNVVQEKKFKNAKGEEIIRLRGRVNTAIAYALYQEQVKQAKKDYPVGAARTERLNDLYKDYLKARTALSSIYLATNINTAQKRIERIEFSAKFTEPKEECTWNNTYTKQTCKNVGFTDVNVKGGINLKKDSGLPIVPPTEFMTIEEVEEYIDSQRPAPLYYEDEYYEDTYGDEEESDEPTSIPQTQTSPVSAVTPGDHVRGFQGAKVTLIQYADLQCPFCQRHVATMEKALVDYPLDVRVVFRHYPLSAIHPEAQKAAEATECAAKLGGEESFWKMHDKIFANQSSMSNTFFISTAFDLGINEAVFTQCLNSGEMAGRVNADVLSGTAAGVEGTPATFVNGTLVSGSVPYEQLKEVIESARAK